MVAMLYRAVTQTVLLCVSEALVLSMAMEKTVEGQIIGKQVQRKADGMWVTPKAEVVREALDNQSSTNYIRRRKGVVAQWVALRPIFKVCAMEKFCDGEGIRRDTWWRKEAPETQLRENLEEMSWEARRRRRGKRNKHWKPGENLGGRRAGIWRCWDGDG